MAIFAPDVSSCIRGSGASACAASAYQSRSSITNEVEGITYNYENCHPREKVLCDLGVSGPADMPEKFSDRKILWNEVEHIESRADARLCHRFMIPLPKELSDLQLIALARYIVAGRVAEGHICDAVIHVNKDGSNPHLHVLEPYRSVDENGFMPKSENVYHVRRLDGAEEKMNAAEFKSRKDEGWEKVYKYKSGQELTQSQAKAAGLNPTKDRVRKQPVQETRYFNDWNSKDKCEQWREEWADAINKFLAEAGVSERVDHRSYERQGIDKIPGLHEGPRATALERAAEAAGKNEPATDVRQANLEIAQANQDIIEVARLDIKIASYQASKRRNLPVQQSRSSRVSLRRRLPVNRVIRQKGVPSSRRAGRVGTPIASADPHRVSRALPLTPQIEIARTEQTQRLLEMFKDIGVTDVYQIKNATREQAAEIGEALDTVAAHGDIYSRQQLAEAAKTDDTLAQAAETLEGVKFAENTGGVAMKTDWAREKFAGSAERNVHARLMAAIAAKQAKPEEELETENVTEPQPAQPTAPAPQPDPMQGMASRRRREVKEREQREAAERQSGTHKTVSSSPATTPAEPDPRVAQLTQLAEMGYLTDAEAARLPDMTEAELDETMGKAAERMVSGDWDPAAGGDVSHTTPSLATSATQAKAASEAHNAPSTRATHRRQSPR